MTLNPESSLAVTGAENGDTANLGVVKTCPPEAGAAGAPEVGSGASHLARAARLTIVLGGCTGFLLLAHAVVLPVVVAWVFGMALKPPMRWLAAARVPVPLAALMVMLAILGPVVWGFSYFSGPAAAWFEEAPEKVTQLKSRLMGVLRPALRLSEAAANVKLEASGSRSPATTVRVLDDRVASGVFTWTGSALVGLAETVALLYLLLASGDSFMQKLVRVMPTFRDKRQVVDMTREIQQGISTYLFSVGSINLGFGAVVAMAFACAGLPQPVMWGLIVALLNFIPYFGPVVGFVLVGAAGLLASPNLGLGLTPVGLYLGLHLLEANVVTPWIIGRRVTLNPVVVFVSLMFFVWLWGVPGAIVAVPILVTARVVCDRVPSLAGAAEFLSR